MRQHEGDTDVDEVYCAFDVGDHGLYRGAAVVAGAV